MLGKFRIDKVYNNYKRVKGIKGQWARPTMIVQETGAGEGQ